MRLLDDVLGSSDLIYAGCANSTSSCVVTVALFLALPSCVMRCRQSIQMIRFGEMYTHVCDLP